MEYTDNLDNYKEIQPTNSCYLDGRYFNKVFHKYPGLIEEPLHIILEENKQDNLQEIVYMKETKIDNKYIGLLRIIIQDKNTRHSNLVLIYYQEKKIYRFEPLGLKAPYFDFINKIIEQYLDKYIDFDMHVFDNTELDEKNPNCEKGGFCNAYIIKFAYDFLNSKTYNPSDIRRFANLIEQKYGPLPDIGKDVEYGLLTGTPVKKSNVLVGALGGAILGGVLTRSPGGIIVGGGLGGLAGALI